MDNWKYEIVIKLSDDEKGYSVKHEVTNNFELAKISFDVWINDSDVLAVVVIVQAPLRKPSPVLIFDDEWGSEWSWPNWVDE